MVAECEQCYCQARWPAGAPGEFAATLAAARLSYENMKKILS